MQFKNRLLMAAVLLLGMGLIFGPLIIGIARSQGMHRGHEHHHDDFYSKWLQADGKSSCCNSKSRHENGDCAPLPQSHLRSTDEGLEVKIDEEWVKVTPEKVRPYHSPDFGHHLCHIGKNILCVVTGGGV